MSISSFHCEYALRVGISSFDSEFRLIAISGFDFEFLISSVGLEFELRFRVSSSSYDFEL